MSPAPLEHVTHRVEALRASFETSTLGGNVATNAGGLCSVKYGVTGDSVLGLEVVLAGGRVLRTGRRSLKRVAGYDLTRLFVGHPAPKSTGGMSREPDGLPPEVCPQVLCYARP